MKGTHGWIIIAVFAYIWDRFATETLSRAFWRGLEHPEARLLVLGIWVWVSSHLLFRHPQKILYWW